MDIQLEKHLPYLEAPVRWDERIARLISDILCPPVTMLIGFLLVVWKSNEPSAWMWASLSILLALGVPVAYVAWKVRQGEISDFHIPIRTQRYRPLALSICCAAFTLLMLWLGQAPKLLIIFTAFGLAHIATIFLITLYWKISGHSAAIASLAFLLIYLLGLPFWPAILLIPIVAWARVRLRRHTLAQTIAGAALGIQFVTLMFLDSTVRLLF